MWIYNLRYNDILKNKLCSIEKINHENTSQNLKSYNYQIRNIKYLCLKCLKKITDGFKSINKIHKSIEI